MDTAPTTTRYSTLIAPTESEEREPRVSEVNLTLITVTPDVQVDQ